MKGLTQYASLAQEAAAAVERRQAQYPALIASGRILADQAAQEIRVWQAIAADWHWVVSLERQEVPPATPEEKLAALEESLRRSDHALNKAFHASDERLRWAWSNKVSMIAIAEDFGDAAKPFLEAWNRFYAIADMLKWARRDLGLEAGRLPIAHFVEQHRSWLSAQRRAA
ncbi:hypothetical protein [Sphingobium sp. YR768]|uniref:hypothetical protein n=1 Tax=Sphingobium sp. YR768 TaxID=1884365 RepID=UPI0008B8FDCA|nr:hypothetical protein [Sphingobium sp. YR768]SEQ59596.1 hypothetical protein SAMN05518866_101462 [Sphingobium sp. YR768]